MKRHSHENLAQNNNETLRHDRNVVTLPYLLCHLSYTFNPYGIWSIISLPQPLTPVEDDVVVGQLAMTLQSGAVPALIPELVLALVYGHLDALKSGGCDIRTAYTHAHLPLTKASQPQTYRVRG